MRLFAVVHRKGLSLRVAPLALAALLGISAIVCWWHHRKAPLRNVLDSGWCSDHSLARYRAEFQKCLSLGYWPHETYGIATLADPALLSVVMSRLDPADDVSSCEFGHLDELLRYATNRDEGRFAGAWLEWWRDNRSRPQADWIRDGFVQRGLFGEDSTEEEIVMLLLKGLGRHRDVDSVRLPPYVAFNAYRYLRLGGFDPVEFLSKERGPVWDEEMLRGVRRYWAFLTSDLVTVRSRPSKAAE
jgi:hypothetical protein